jgi:hypothetical protein
LEPLRRKAKLAETTAARLAAERQALDRSLLEPDAFGGQGTALSDALKRRAELARMIAEAESEWFEAEAELERLAQG